MSIIGPHHRPKTLGQKDQINHKGDSNEPPKINPPQYVLTVTNLFGYKTNISKEFDILCFTSILCIFSVVDVLGNFFLNKLIAKVCFVLIR